MIKPAVGLLASLTVVAACSSGSEKFCTLGLVLPFVEVDLSELPSADQVCLADAACVRVREGVAELRSPLITNDTTEVLVSVRDNDGTVVAEADVRLPRIYGNGFECGGDGPGGTVTFESDGGVSVSEDVDGSGAGRKG